MRPRSLAVLRLAAVVATGLLCGACNMGGPSPDPNPVPPGGYCAGKNEHCGTSGDCCGVLTCDNGTRTCVDAVCRDSGGHCSSSSDCCGTLTCDGGICGSGSCRSKGAHCSSGADCCGTLTCDNGICSDGGCFGAGAHCTSGIDCCGTLSCNSSTHTCY